MNQTDCAAMGEMMGSMMGQMTSGGMMGGGWGAGIIWLGLVVVVLVGIGVALAIVLSRRPVTSTADDPGEILRRRFARGEISAEEFSSAMKTLS